MDFDLSCLGERGFERMVQAIASRVLGSSFRAYGAGPDGGRDGTFELEVPLDASEGGGSRLAYGVIQAKYKNGVFDTAAGTSWLKGHVRHELEQWADPALARVRDGRVPEVLLFATNVNLSAVPGRGGADELDALIHRYKDRLNLRRWVIWDYAQLCCYLVAYEDVRNAVGLITPGDVLAKLHSALNGAPAIGEGIPGAAAAFQDGFDLAGGSGRIGQPRAAGYEDPLGYVQHFRRPDGRAAVICALYGQSAVVVSSEWWSAISTLSPAPGVSGGLAGAGFPMADPLDPAAFLDTRATAITLRGGSWGPGTAARTPSGGYRWGPDVLLTMQAARDRDAWAIRTQKNALRLRVAARPAVLADELAVIPAGRARLTAALAKTPLAESLRSFVSMRGVADAQVVWRLHSGDDSYNDRRFATYRAQLDDETGNAVLTTDLRVQMPDGISSEVFVLVDIRIDLDFVLRAPVLGGADLSAPNSDASGHGDLGPRSGDRRITVDELYHLFRDACTLADVDALTAVHPDPAGLPPRGAPKTELHIGTEHVQLSDQPTLDRFIDLSAFGACQRSLPSAISVGFVAPRDLSSAERGDLIAIALVRMAEEYGFLDAEEWSQLDD